MTDTDPRPGCRHCTRPTGDDAILCSVCGNQLREHLADLPGLDIDAAAAKQGRRGAGGARGKGEAQPLIVDLKAADLAAEIRTELVNWVRLLTDRTEALWPADTIPSMSVWLGNRVQAVRHHEAGADAMRLVTLVRQVRRLVDSPAERQFLGSCGAQFTDDTPPCDQMLWTEQGKAQATCPRCRAVWDVPERRDWLLELAEDQIMPAIEAAWMTHHLTDGKNPDHVAGLIRNWAARGHLSDCGADFRGRPLYRLSEIITRITGQQRRAVG